MGDTALPVPCQGLGVEGVTRLAAPPPDHTSPRHGTLPLLQTGPLHPLHGEGDMLLLVTPRHPDLEDEGGRRKNLVGKERRYRFISLFLLLFRCLLLLLFLLLPD